MVGRVVLMTVLYVVNNYVLSGECTLLHLPDLPPFS